MEAQDSIGTRGTSSGGRHRVAPEGRELGAEELHLAGDFGLACCAIEMMKTVAPGTTSRASGWRRSGVAAQADLMIVAGRVSQKMAPVFRHIYDQMPEPKWVISMGACASCGGMFNNYAILQGVDQIVPVDVYVAGCPPTPEILMAGILQLHRQIPKQPLKLGSAGGRQPWPTLDDSLRPSVNGFPRSLSRATAWSRWTSSWCPPIGSLDTLTVLRDALGFGMLMDITVSTGSRGSRDTTSTTTAAARGRRAAARESAARGPREPHAADGDQFLSWADCMEREVFDFFGFVFAGHPNLTRILMPDEWVGHPLAQGLPSRWRPGRVPDRAGLRRAERRPEPGASGSGRRSCALAPRSRAPLSHYTWTGPPASGVRLLCRPSKVMSRRREGSES